MRPPLDPQVATALTDAVHDLERQSCAEVVVEIRARSGSYSHADARFAALLAFLGLLLLLFSPWPFAPVWVAVDVALLYAIGWFGASRSDGLRRVMTTERERMERVRTIAMAAFHDRGVANTDVESGLLVYLSLLERHIEVVADRGVLVAVPPLEWNQVITEARRQRATPATLVVLIRALAPLLERCLPRREDDRDELANAPRFVHE